MIQWFIDRFGVEEGTRIANIFSYFLEAFGGHCEEAQVLAILEALYARRHTQRRCLTAREAKAEVMELYATLVDNRWPEDIDFEEVTRRICAIIDRMSEVSLPPSEAPRKPVTEVYHYEPKKQGKPVTYAPREERIIVA